MYTTGQLSTLFGVNEITIKRWVERYGDFLSKSAQPARGKTRLFDDSDLEVFALVIEKGEDKLSTSEIYTLLKQGKRGVPPTGKELSIVTTHQMTTALATANQTIERLERERDELRDRASRAEGREDLLREILKEKEAEIARLRGDHG